MLLDELDDACIRDKVRCYVENGAKIIRICFGEEHRLFKEHVRSLLDSVCTCEYSSGEFTYRV